MKLPSTREEFTHFALEYSREGFWRKYIRSHCEEVAPKLEQWIKDTYAKFPEVVEHVKIKNGDVYIVFVGVEIITLHLARLWELDILSSVVRHHYDKYGEFL